MKPFALRKLIAAALTALTAGTLTTALAPSASASPAPNSAVLFGDSVAANPTVIDYVGNKINPRDPRFPATRSGCASDHVFPKKFTARTGKLMYNYSCSGASFTEGGMHISKQLDMAAQQGKIGPQTSTVVILAGANDTYTKILNQKKSVAGMIGALEPQVVRDLQKARRLAPNAKVKLIGYPTIADRAGNTCVIGHVPPVVFDRRIPEVERAMDAMGARVAAKTGTQFVSLKAASRNHDMCSRDPWLAPLIASPKPANLPLHLTTGGINGVVSGMVR